MKNDTDKIKKEKDDDEQVIKDEEKGKEEIEKLEQKVKELDNSYKRALADYQNLQKRVTEERRDWLKIANKELLLRLLPVLDTLMLAYKHTQTEDLKVVINQFLDVLKAEEVMKIDTKDQDFDPQIMEVVETSEGEDGKVLEEVRAGFLIYDKLLRAVQVKVGKKNES